MKQPVKIINYSLLVVLGCLCAAPSIAGVRVSNSSRSRGDTYAPNANDAARAGYIGVAQTVDTASNVNLPVRVADSNMATQIANGGIYNDIGISNLESCAAIYPNGEFAWDKPNVGLKANGPSTCVAVVELRGAQMGAGGSDAILARAYVAAGDSFNCNISAFPSASYTADAGRIEFPADAEPTREDVIQVMNQEQKQNAVFKIAAGAILGGVVGNVSGKNEVGKDGMFGAGKDKLITTAVGAVGGAAFGAGGAYGGKVGGDMIQSIGVNAVAGGMIGNMAASGDNVLRIERCECEGKETHCLWGYYQQQGSAAEAGEKLDKKAFHHLETGKTIVCDAQTDNTYKCHSPTKAVADFYLVGQKGITTNTEIPKNTIQALKRNGNWGNLSGHFGDGQELMEKDYKNISDSRSGWYEIEELFYIEKREMAMICGFEDKAFGWREKDWNKWIESNPVGFKVYARGGDGKQFGTECLKKADTGECVPLTDFKPAYVGADDGGIIDISNKARLKSTAAGAGVGGALGGFTAYQGAQSEIDERWVAAQREYKDSLQKIYCVTGQRFLSYYNSPVVIPLPTE